MVNMIIKTLNASYDEEADVLIAYSNTAKVHESVEVAEDLIIDLDKDKRIVNVELFDAYKFLHTFNKKISKQTLCEIEEVELHFTNYRNYWIISVVFKHNNEIFEEKLPAFTKAEYKSPLLA